METPRRPENRLRMSSVVRVNNLIHRVENEARSLEMRTHFDEQSRFTFEKLIGRGAFGMTFRIVEKLGPTETRRLAVKRAMHTSAQRDLRNEIRWLRRLRGAEHIAKIIADRDDSVVIIGTRRLRRAWSRRTIGPTAAGLIGLTGPVMMLEYLENADVASLWQRLVKHGATLPNRVLWAFFLCLVRACIGLAYPMNGKPGDPTRLETLPADGRAPGMIEHGDIHLANVMVGSSGGPFLEHYKVPVLKFIDLGMAKEGAVGVTANLWKASLTIYTLISRAVNWRRDAPRTTWGGIETYATEILPPRGAQFPTLDPELRNLVASCLATRPQDRPPLAQLLQRVEEGAAKTAVMYPPPVDRRRETDEFIDAVLKRLIYDQDTEPDQAGFDAVVWQDIMNTVRAMQMADGN